MLLFLKSISGTAHQAALADGINVINDHLEGRLALLILGAFCDLGGVEAGVLDVPFAPCRANAGLMLPCRDNNGAVRILNPGHLPFSKDLLDFHAAKIEERAKFEKRKASFQMVIDDVYSIGKGRLVGRPRY